MRRNTLNFATDFLTFAAMLGMIATGLVMKFTLPPRTGGRLSVWGLDRHEWGDVHFWFAVALLSILLVHVALHWSWVCIVVRRSLAPLAATGATTTARMPAVRRRRRLYGIATLAALVALVAGFRWIVATGVSETRGEAGIGPEHRRSAQQGWSRPGESSMSEASGELQIHGATTIGELATSLELSLEQVAARLGLPSEISPDERLGRLCRSHGLRMSDVRRAAAELRAGQRGQGTAAAHTPEDCDQTEP